MFDFGKNKNKNKSEDNNGPDYMGPLQDEAAGLIRNESRDSIKKLEAQSRAGINAGMKAYLDLQTALSTAELSLHHPHLDVIKSAMIKFEYLRHGGFKELSEDEKNIAEQADQEVYRLYQDRERELWNSTPTSLNALGQDGVEYKREDLALNKEDDVSQKPTAALGARPKEEQRSPPSRTHQECVGSRRNQEHTPKVLDWVDQYEPRCESPRERRLSSPKRGGESWMTRYYQQETEHLEPKLETPRSRNQAYIEQKLVYGAREQFRYREQRNDAALEHYGESYDGPRGYIPTESFYCASEPDHPERQRIRNLDYSRREPEYRTREDLSMLQRRYEADMKLYGSPNSGPRGYVRSEVPYHERVRPAGNGDSGTETSIRHRVAQLPHGVSRK